MGKWEDYEILKLLGKGSFGSVYSVRKTNDRSMHVLKKISIHNMPAKERKATEVECKVLERLRHPGIVCYEDSFIHKNRNLCIIMAFCEGGDLASVIEKRRMRQFPENEVINWFLQIGLAIQYMHEAHILHRDIKTQNIFLTKDNMIKVGDFGIAKVLEGTLEMAKTVIGTPYYMGPELFRNQPYSFKSDIWSLGCVLFELMALRHAFEARDMNGLVQKIFRGSYAPIPSRASKDMRDLIKGMLSISPGGRPSMSEILCRPFLRKEMSSYIQNSLGDESVAAFIRDDPKLLGYHRAEQDHLEKQARKLGFDVKKDTGGSADSVIDSRPQQAKVEAKSNVGQLDARKAQPEQRRQEKPAIDAAKIEQERREAEKARLEEKEKERQRRAQAFLEKELRAKERAEAALKQLQKEKMEKMKKLQEERERRQKRMQNVHPKGEAGLVGEWQQRLANARAQHEQRRKEQGMVAPAVAAPPAAAAPAAAAPRPKAEEHGQIRGVLEQRNAQARQREHDRASQAEADKENIQNILERKPKQQAANKPDKHNAQKAENDRLKNEMNRDMDQMEAKLQAMKDRKDAEHRQKRMAEERVKDHGGQQQKQQQKYQPQPPAQPQPAHQHSRNPQPVASDRPNGNVPIKERQPLQPPPAQPGSQQRSNPPSQASSRSQANSRQDDRINERQQQIREYMQNRQQGQESRLGNRPPAVQLQDNRMHQALPESQYTPAARYQEARQSMPQAPQAAGYMQPMYDVRSSDPSFMPSVYSSHASNPPPNRLQAVPSPAHWPGQGAYFDGGDGFTGDLISRQKELDRQHARQQIAQDYDSDMQQFQMNMHRVNQAVSSSMHGRANILPGQVGAKISERDRQLRMRQQAAHQRMRQQMGYTPQHKMFGDVAYEGAVYSPKKVQWAAAPGDEFDEDDIEDEVGQNLQRSINFDIEPIDEELAQYDNEEAELEREVAQRTLKIQMLKTAVMNDDGIGFV